MTTVTRRRASLALLSLAASATASLLLPGAARAQAGGAPPAADPMRMVDALEGTFGQHAGARRSHAKGVCASGHFVGSAEGRALSVANVFAGSRVPVLARFSVGGGNPMASDKARSVRGLALAFELPGQERWLMANLSAPVFFVARPEHFAGFIEARRPDPATGRPDPARVRAFNEAHPDTKPQIDWLAQAPVPASYAGVPYWSTHAFRFIDARGQARFAKWSFQPVGGIEGLSDAALAAQPDHFLIDELRTRVARAPIEFSFMLQLAEPGDDTTNPTVTWPASRRTVEAGRLVIDRVEAGTGGACDGITFNPLVLPRGIEPSADPVLLARAAPYAVSLGRRLATSR
jgi:catalase